MHKHCLRLSRTRTRLLITATLAFATVASVGASDRTPGDPKAGAVIYARCAGCHALTHHSIGPLHCGLFGRRAGTAMGFSYSEDMKRSRITWNESTLNRFLENPTKAMPGTEMLYVGVPDKKERTDLIAYLRQASESPECRNLK